MKPDIIAFHASSFCLTPFTTQSNVENIPPHTPKLPPVTGARAFIEDIAPTKRSPCWVQRELEVRGIIQACRTYPWRVSGTFYAVPYTTTNSSHCKCTSEVIEDDPRAVRLNLSSRIWGEIQLHPYQGSLVWSACDILTGEGERGNAGLFEWGEVIEKVKVFTVSHDTRVGTPSRDIRVRQLLCNRNI